jgi:glucosamine--fructose-6-phosphate aminotransferase (isomerizing)
MCGIIGYTGQQSALPMILTGLSAMEYRGYDSSGVMLASDHLEVEVVKAVGKLSHLREKVEGLDRVYNLGIGHNRWATHGGAVEKNAHPHTDCKNRFWLAHNGIIENYEELKNELVASGHHFKSETDSEIIAHLIETFSNKGASFEESVRRSLARLKGTYGLVIADKQTPGVLIAVRQFSPLLLAKTLNGVLVASDQLAFADSSADFVIMRDGDLAVITGDDYKIFALDNTVQNHTKIVIEKQQGFHDKGTYPHFMLKEISMQPQSLTDSLRGRVDLKTGQVLLGGLREVEDILRDANRLIFIGCGTAYHAGLLASLITEQVLKISAHAEIASEFRYRKPVLLKGDVVIAVSQSGETADTLAAVMYAKQQGIPTLGLINVVGSSIAREVDAGVYLHAGPEFSVASTKAFTSQVTTLILIILSIGQIQKKLVRNDTNKLLAGITRLPSVIANVVSQQTLIQRMAVELSHFERFLFIGRKLSMPVAMEGALKLTELAYVPAMAFGAGEMKHGPMALADNKTACISIAPVDDVFDKTLSNSIELHARQTPVFVLTNKANMLPSIFSRSIVLPYTDELLAPIVFSVPLQLLAYHIALLKGNEIDQPRNLAKSVTVE